ncbi:hypothetical protein VTL71DRAFT_2746, partial [Oculimacula yallundae]
MRISTKLQQRSSQQRKHRQKPIYSKFTNLNSSFYGQNQRSLLAIKSQIEIADVGYEKAETRKGKPKSRSRNGVEADRDQNLCGAVLGELVLDVLASGSLTGDLGPQEGISKFEVESRNWSSEVLGKVGVDDE